MNPSHRVTWKPTRPDFAITCLRGTSTNRGYHETWYEVVSWRELSADALEALSRLGLLGSGQAYNLEKTDALVDTVPAVTVDALTGQVLADVPPVNWQGQPIVGTHDYTYHRYVVKRICDSGD